MKKKKEITVTMPNPCKKREWNDMTPNKTGRHCSNCDFTVIDFTAYTDKELVDFLLKSKGKVCGMFENYQLGRPMSIPPGKNNTLRNRALLSAALFTGVATGINGQNTIPVQTPIQNSINQSTQQKPNKDIKPQTLKGIVTSRKKKIPLEEAIISIKGSNGYAETDTNGAFELILPDSLVGKKLTLQIERFEYKNQNITIDTSIPLPDIQIVLIPESKFHLFRKKRTYRTIGCPSF